MQVKQRLFDVYIEPPRPLVERLWVVDDARQPSGLACRRGGVWYAVRLWGRTMALGAEITSPLGDDDE